MTDYLRDASVIIADDQEFIANVLREMLRVLGARDIRVVYDGEAGWKEYKARPSDIVILDWEMKPMNGLELTSRIRKDPESPNKFVPIIMVTAHREKANVFRARDAGVTEFVIKPISPKALFSRIEAVIERPRRFVRVGKFFGPDRRRQKQTFEGEDRRGKEKPPSESGQPTKKQDMGQDEINKTFNPDDDTPK